MLKLLGRPDPQAFTNSWPKGEYKHEYENNWVILTYVSAWTFMIEEEIVINSRSNTFEMQIYIIMVSIGNQVNISRIYLETLMFVHLQLRTELFMNKRF